MIMDTNRGDCSAEHCSAIKLEGVYFGYEQRLILTDVQLDIRPLDTICIVGPNGGGKTTLIKLMLGLLTPDRGTIKIFGQKPKNARLRMGYVAQHTNFDSQFPISVKDVVCMGRLGHSITGHYTARDREAVEKALEQVDLQEQQHRSFVSLSGGQRQRVLIARALACGGDILILDEPTSSIDRESEQRFFQLLSSLNQKMTILMVTHELGFASSFFKRIACVNNQVVIHPTSKLTGELIQDMYGGDLRMIRHDHFCSEEGHIHD